MRGQSRKAEPVFAPTRIAVKQQQHQRENEMIQTKRSEGALLAVRGGHDVQTIPTRRHAHVPLVL